MKFKIFRFKKVKSTNSTAIRIIKNYKFNYGMIISETQNKGRGQYGRKWISYKGNLFASFFYKTEDLAVSVRQLTKINCILVKELLSKYYKKKITFKKPNDLLINKKKICGILQESISISDKKYLVVGIGINLIKSPDIKNYSTTYLGRFTNKSIRKSFIYNDIKKSYEKKFTTKYI